MDYKPLYRLKGTLLREKKIPGGGVSLGAVKEINVEDLELLKNDLKIVREKFINSQEFFTGVLVSARYRRVTSKSRRIGHIFPQKQFFYKYP